MDEGEPAQAGLERQRLDGAPGRRAPERRQGGRRLLPQVRRLPGAASAGRADEIWSARRDDDRDLDAQRRLASSLGKISPAGLFDEAAEVAAGSDLAGDEGFIAQAALYREAVFRYLRAKDAVHSLRYFTVMEEKDLLPLAEYRKRTEPRKPDGSFYEETDYPPLARSSSEVLLPPGAGAAEILPRVLLSLLVLGAINLGLFFGAVAAFARYDVR